MKGISVTHADPGTQCGSLASCSKTEGAPVLNCGGQRSGPALSD